MAEKFSVEIDQDRLDVEWVSQPKRYHHVAVQLADARRNAEEARANLDVTRAELEMAIRKDPDDYGLQKITEAGIAAAILLQGDYTTAQTACIDAKHRVDVLTAAVTAMDHRKKALENLVELHGRDYFSEPKVSSERARAAVQDIENKQFRKMGQRKKQ